MKKEIDCEKYIKLRIKKFYKFQSSSNFLQNAAFVFLMLTYHLLHTY